MIAPDGKLIKELMPRVENKEEVERIILDLEMMSFVRKVSRSR